MSHLHCPSCRLTLRTRNALPVDYCPRCLARRHKAVPLSHVATPPRAVRGRDAVRRGGPQTTA